MPNMFIWTDLSTFDVRSCKSFYSVLFAWKFSTNQGFAKDDYYIATQDRHSLAAVFTMPELYQKFNMPSFWMSYIHVDNIDEIVQKARQHKDAIVEIESLDYGKSSRVALIRDPSGAGFTIYEGPDLQGRYATGHGRMVWNVLHVNDKNLIEDFYQDLFAWQLRAQLSTSHGHGSVSSEIYDVIHADGEIVATLEVLADDVKGEKQYWMPVFAVDDLEKRTKKIIEIGGTCLTYLDDKRSLCSDLQGGHFIIQQDRQAAKASESEDSVKQAFKWKTILGLIAIWFAVFSNANWLWGILFLLWIIPDLRRRETHFVEYLSAKENPVLFWALMLSWIVFAVYLIIEPLLF